MLRRIRGNYIKGLVCGEASSAVLPDTRSLVQIYFKFFIRCGIEGNSCVFIESHFYCNVRQVDWQGIVYKEREYLSKIRNRIAFQRLGFGKISVQCAVCGSGQ